MEFGGGLVCVCMCVAWGGGGGGVRNCTVIFMHTSFNTFINKPFHIPHHIATGKARSIYFT